MAKASRIIRPLISVLLIGATILGLINVYGDNLAVRQKAERTACGSPSCAVTLTREERNPISQNFTFQTSRRRQAGSSRTTDVTCQRAYYLFGEYACKRSSP